MQITQGTIHNLPIGTKLICLKNGGHDNFFTIGQEYIISIVNPNDQKTYVKSNQNTDWFIETEMVFETINDVQLKKKISFEAGELVKCIDATGELELNKYYTIKSIYPKGLKIEGSEIKWKFSRFAKLEWSPGKKVKFIGASGGKYKNGSIYIISDRLVANNSLVCIAKADDGSTDIAFRKNGFILLDEQIKLRKKKFKSLKLNAEKMHTHNCLNCTKQIFPKLMCKCKYDSLEDLF